MDDRFPRMMTETDRMQGTGVTAAATGGGTRTGGSDFTGALRRVLATALACGCTAHGTSVPEAPCACPGVVRDFMARGGKRTRAQLVRHAWRAVGGADAGPAHARVVRLAASLELIQACAVVHDDLIDGADRRRDAPTLHRACAAEHRGQRWSGDSDRYGVAQAVLAGDLALARADDLVLDVCCEDPGAGRRIRGLWRTMREEMVAGQRLELRLQAERSGSAEAALSVARLKSGGYSVQRPLELGAALAGAGPGQMSALGGFGARIGLAFQLVDDFRDVFCDDAGLGKRPGSDLAEGKRTYMVLQAMETAATGGHLAGHGDVVRAAFGNPDLDAEALERVRVAMRALGTETEILDLVARLRREACALLHTADLDPAAVADLVELADRMIDPGSGATVAAGAGGAGSGARTGGEAWRCER